MTTLESGISHSLHHGTLSLSVSRSLICYLLEASINDAITLLPSLYRQTKDAILLIRRPSHFLTFSPDFGTIIFLLDHGMFQECFLGNGSLQLELSHRARPWYQHSRVEILCTVSKWPHRTSTNQPYDYVLFYWWFLVGGRLVYRKRIYWVSSSPQLFCLAQNQ